MHRCVRPLVRRLARTGVTPDQLTVLRLLTGLTASACFAVNQHTILIGSAVLLCSLFLDRADGELARQTGRFSRWGWRFDLIADCVSTMSIFLCIGIGLRADFHPFDAETALPWIPLALGSLSAVGAAILFWILNATPSGDTEPGPVAIDPDDLMFALPFLLAFGFAQDVLVAASVLLPISIVFVWTRSSLGLARPHGKPQHR